ncbi:hypothetical protein ACFFGV_01115 [Pontibacillus salicampi]|uniref:YrzI family small protein n=1 Tax=Pontibacillus salicampi TaxID=1449801 RepID=A0ABV6LIH7_9BACI
MQFQLLMFTIHIRKRTSRERVHAKLRHHSIQQKMEAMKDRRSRIW